MNLPLTRQYFELCRIVLPTEFDSWLQVEPHPPSQVSLSQSSQAGGVVGRPQLDHSHAVPPPFHLDGRLVAAPSLLG